MDESNTTEKTDATRKQQGKNYEILTLLINDIEIRPQPRNAITDEEIRELASDIEEQGFIHPLTVRHEDGVYVLVIGERRLRAARLLGFTHVPAVLNNEVDALGLQLSENLLRKDLTPAERAAGLQELMRRKDYTFEQLARLRGKAISTTHRQMHHSSFQNGMKSVKPKARLLPVTIKVAKDGALKLTIAFYDDSHSAEARAKFIYEGVLQFLARNGLEWSHVLTHHALVRSETHSSDMTAATTNKTGQRNKSAHQKKLDSVSNEPEQLSLFTTDSRDDT
jgi:ParB/RepB/Spo0J family partition protein